MTNNINKTLKLLRQKSKLSQSDLGDKLGITQVHISNIENGKTTPSIDLIEKLSDFFDTDLFMLSWALFGDVSKLPQKLQKHALKLQQKWRVHYDEHASKIVQS